MRAFTLAMALALVALSSSRVEACEPLDLFLRFKTPPMAVAVEVEAVRWQVRWKNLLTPRWEHRPWIEKEAIFRPIRTLVGSKARPLPRYSWNPFDKNTCVPVEPVGKGQKLVILIESDLAKARRIESAIHDAPATEGEVPLPDIEYEPISLNNEPIELAPMMSAPQAREYVKAFEPPDWDALVLNKPPASKKKQ